MKSNRTMLLPALASLLLIYTIIFSLTINVTGQEAAPAINPGSNGVLFAIGVVDSDTSEFQKFDWDRVNDYECTVGVNCESKNFPAHLLKKSVLDRWDYSGVAEVNINFNINQTYENLFLRLVRAGSDTTIVKLDDRGARSVTSRMLNSHGHAYGKLSTGFGSYDLGLGTLDAGIHNIKLTINEHDMGDGRYRWDAIILLIK